MIKFKIKIPNLDKFNKISDETYEKILMKSMFKMEELAVDKAPVSDGYLRLNITLFPQVLSKQYMLISKASYSVAMEYGTRPYYAPIKPLKEWAAKKLGDEELGWAVRAKIAKFGVTAHPFMRPAFYQVSDYWVQEFAKNTK